ncbi:polysaccharide deacetylase family protein [Exiguobacterium sp. B2(2022)]|uniref:polysaccharide deacetylase family protein n=1 Tax=Exiguobacterium sp. B2(2022) TaxID=2992755 RepID=UPI00237A5214|nr:polysaccharide deacetylase family protein [Exiguobacterium sp. B2(2022)]MDE0562431.1 polysaccharide deacetylase family protein [Exiguobacterium sp. B2(2022)]
MKKRVLLLMSIFLLIGTLSQAAIPEPKAYNDPSLIYLTLDDGPNWKTGKLLDVLKKHQVKATFFILGKNIEGNEHLLHRIVDEGHLIALHGMTHKREEFYASPMTAVRQMKDVQRLVYEVTGIHTNMARTIYGSDEGMTPAHWKVMNEAGFEIWDWNVGSLDHVYKQENAWVEQRVFNRLEANRAANIASIILAHDHSMTPEALDTIIRYAKERDYEFRTLEGVHPPHNFSDAWEPHASESTTP